LVYGDFGSGDWYAIDPELLARSGILEDDTLRQLPLLAKFQEASFGHEHRRQKPFAVLQPTRVILYLIPLLSG